MKSDRIKLDRYRYATLYDSCGPDEYGWFYKQADADKEIKRLREEVEMLKIRLARWEPEK